MPRDVIPLDFGKRSRLSSHCAPSSAELPSLQITERPNPAPLASGVFLSSPQPKPAQQARGMAPAPAPCKPVQPAASRGEPGPRLCWDGAVGLLGRSGSSSGIHQGLCSPGEPTPFPAGVRAVESRVLSTISSE